MAKKFEYTTLAHRYTAQFPLLTYLGTQVNFWIIANVLLVIIMNMQTHLISSVYNIVVPGNIGGMMLIGILSGVLYGVVLGLAGYYLDKKMFRNLPQGKIILFKTITSLAVLILLLVLFRYVFFNWLISPSLFAQDIVLNEESWESVFYLLTIYYFFMTPIISFINLVNRKYGPGILLPLLLGRYREPKEEERIFMFMDLKSSTTTAEKLGHLKYSAFIRDCFSDINEVLYSYRAQVYQYVGDEIVVTWPESEGIKKHFCIDFYFACKKQFQERSQFYIDTYGLLPSFKAGLHSGKVMAVEIGDVKRDIAYHGDTLNTAARIQSVCNEYGTTFLVSKVLLDKVGLHNNMQTQPLGMILLKGKSEAVELVSIEWTEATVPLSS